MADTPPTRPPPSATPRSTTAPRESAFLAPGRRASGRGTQWLESVESGLYLVVGGCFLVAAVLSLVYGLITFGAAVAKLLQSGLLAPGNAGAGASAIIMLVSDLLLTLIILEVMSTVVRYLQVRATSLKPFLIIGIISATRSILAVGARLSVSSFQQLSSDEFRDAMVELGVNAAVIIALGVTLRLIAHFSDDRLEVAPAPADVPR